MAFPTELGKRIKARREGLKISRPDLADAARIPYTTLAGIENGDTRSLGHEALGPVAKILQVTTDWLLGLDPAPPGPDRVGELLSPRENAVLRAFRTAKPAEKRAMEAFIASFQIRRPRVRKEGRGPQAEPRPPPQRTGTR